MNSLNDPFLGTDVIDYDIFKSNPHTVLATNKYAGHLGYHEDIRSQNQWMPAPCLNFIEGVRSERELI
jgi:uncharacterized protein